MPSLDLDRLGKFCFSFFKRGWNLEDYPVRFRHQEPSSPVPLALKGDLVPWLAQIPYWVRMTGSGNTREEAYANLQKRFDEYRAEGNKLPRPGTKVPLQFAPRLEVPLYDDIAADFFRRILNMDYRNVFITDKSSLWDFPIEDPVEELVERIREAYSVDIGDIEDGNLVSIFRRLQDHTDLAAHRHG